MAVLPDSAQSRAPASAYWAALAFASVVGYKKVMITDRDPTSEEYTKLTKSQRWNCVAAALFAITLGAIAVLEIVRASDGEMRTFGYVLLALAVGYALVFWRSLRQYREMVARAL